jgi:lipid-A-disaccharide synthase
MLAGEQSGVFYAERLKGEIERAAGDAVEFRGYGDYGFKTVDLAVMGIGPVLMRIFYFMRVARTMKRAIREWRPDVVVTIDYPGMNIKLAAYAKGLGIPAVHVVCPQVWAWHRGRVPKIAASLTKLLCFLPFEPAIFPTTPGFKAVFIGHPLIDVFAEEKGASSSAVENVRSAGAEKVVALLPGSRKGEIERILPRLLDAAEMLNGRIPRLAFVIPAASARARRQIDEVLAKRPLPGVTCVDGGARGVLRSADVAAVASGTATLEAALARVPTALVYATTPFFAWLIRYFVTGVRFAGLANIIAERCACGGKDPPKRRPGEGPGKGGPMPELLQEDFTPSALVDILAPWLSDSSARAAAVARLDSATALLRSDGAALGLAAREVLSAISERSA